MIKVTFIPNPRAKKIIGTYSPIGSFLTWEVDRYVAIDNTTGDAWTEEFKKLNAAVQWLQGQGPKEMYESDNPA